MYDITSSFTNEKNTMTAEEIDAQRKAIEKAFLAELSIIIVKCNKYTGFQKYDVDQDVAIKTLDDVVYVSPLKDIGSKDQAEKDGFIVYEMIKDSSITILPKVFKRTLYFSNKTLRAAVVGQAVAVEVVEESTIEEGVLHFMSVTTADDFVRVDSSIIKTEVKEVKE